MAVELATAYVSIVPSASGIRASMLKEFGPDIDRAASDSGDRAGRGFAGGFGTHLKAIAGTAAAVFAGQAAIGFLKDSVSAASDLGETVTKATQIFGQEAVPALEKYASTAATTMGQSRQQALDAAATFGVFGKSAGLAGGDLVDFSTEMVGLSSDLASFGNTTVDEAIESIGAALRGEAEPIRKYGILLDDATLRQRALSLGIISTTKDALTPAQKVLAAQAEILAQTSDAQGDFARTSGGLANQQRILAAQVSNLKARFGEALLPAMTALAKMANTVLLPALERFIPLMGAGITEAIGKAGTAFGYLLNAWGAFVLGWTEGDRDIMSGRWWGFLEALGGRLGFVWQELTGGFRAFVEAFRIGDGDITSAGFPGFMEEMGYRVRQAWDVVVTTIAGFRGEVLDTDSAIAGTALEGWAQRMGGHMGKLRDFARENEAAFAAAGIGAGSFLLSIQGIQAATAAANAIGGLGEIVGALAGPFVSLVAAVGPIGILVAVVAALAAAGVYAYRNWEPFRDVVDTVARTIKDVALVVFERTRDVLRGLGSAASTGAAAVRTALTPLVNWVENNVGPVFVAAGEYFTALFQRISDVVRGWWQLMEMVWSVVGPIVMAALEVVRSVIETFVNVARPLLEGWLTFVWQYVSFVWDVVKNVIETVLGVITGLIQVATGVLTGDWRKAWEGIKTIVTSVLGNLYDILRGVPQRILDALGNLGSTLWEAGRALLQGLINGLESLWHLANTTMAGIPGRILTAIGDLGRLLWDVGRDLIRGLIDGVRSMAGAAKDAVVDVVTAPVGWAKSALGIGSPSKVMMDMGVDLMLGYEQGIQARMGKVEALGADIASATTGPIASVRPRVASAGSLAGASAGRGGSINNVTIIPQNKVDPRGVVREWEWYSRTAGV
jgi:phage-related protein